MLPHFMINTLTICLLLALVGISLRMSLKLLYGARGPRNEDPIYQILNVLGWGLLLFPSALLLVFGASFFSLLLGLLAFSTLVEMVVARREIQRRGVWSLLSVNRQGRLPEPESLRLHGSRFTGIVGRAFRRLCDSLETGLDIRLAVAGNPKALPREAQAYAAISALEAGALSVDSASDCPGQTAPPVEVAPQWQSLYRNGSYLVTVLLLMLGVISFVVIKIVPSFQAIFEDFDLQLPDITIHFISVANLAARSTMALWVLIYLFLFLLGVFIVAILYLCDLPVLRPLLDRIFFGFHKALILRLLAITTEKGQSLNANITHLVDEKPSYPSSYVRRRLKKLSQRLQLGENWKDSLVATSIIQRADIPLLMSAESAGNLPWVLRLLADKQTRSLMLRWSVFQEIAFPIIILLLGMFVGFFCIAMFLPLVELIQSLT